MLGEQSRGFGRKKRGKVYKGNMVIDFNSHRTKLSTKKILTIKQLEW